MIEAKVALVSDEDDLALLKTDEKLTIEPLKLRKAAEAGLNELSPVIVFGYPFGRRLAAQGQDYPSISINTGRVSRLEKVDGELSQIQYDAATNPGNSGGPMITPDGSTVGVVVSGFRGAAVNFAIPAERVLALVEKPVITLYPTIVPFTDRHKNQDFVIQLLPNTPLPDDPEVQLHLGAPGPDRRSFPAELRDGAFHVIAPLVEAPGNPKPLRLHIEATLPDATITTSVADRIVTVDGEEVALSEVVAVVEENGTTKTVLARPSDGRPFALVDGVPSGLPKLHSERHELELELEKLRGLRVQSYGFAPIEIPFEIEVRGKSGVKLSRAGTARLGDLPANLTGSTRPKKKDMFGDMFSGMFGRDSRSNELDLLSLVDLKKDARSGTWELDRETGDVVTEEESAAWLALPVQPTGSFGITVEFVPSKNGEGECWIQLPVGDSSVVLHFDGGEPGRALVANDPAHGDDEALEFPAFRKGIPFKVQAMVRDGKVEAALTITRKSGNSTSRMPLGKELKWSGDVADLKKLPDCPVPPGTLGVGLSGMKARVTTLEIGASRGGLLVSRELPPTIELKPAAPSVHWSLDKTEFKDMVRGRERDGRQGGFAGLMGGDMSYAGKTLGKPDIGAGPCLEGEGAMRVDGDKAGFQLPSHPRLWKPSFTTAFWFRTDEIEEGKRRHLFDEGGRHTGASIYLIGDTLRAGAWDDSAEKKGNQWDSWLEAPGLKAGEWYHVALALDAEADDPDTALRLFLNGTPVGEGFAKPLNKQREPGAVGTILGSSRPCPKDPKNTQRTQFVGMIDDFSIHRVALDIDQLALIVGGRFGEKGASFPAQPDGKKSDDD